MKKALALPLAAIMLNGCFVDPATMAVIAGSGIAAHQGNKIINAPGLQKCEVFAGGKETVVDYRNFVKVHTLEGLENGVLCENDDGQEDVHIIINGSEHDR